MQSRKVLFLDVDGVLNNRFTTESFDGLVGVEKDKCAMLDQIAAETGCDIVLSSTWRHHPASVNYLFSKLSPATRRVVIGKTASLPHLDRGGEIQHWLDENPDVTCFVIVDDDNDMSNLTSHLVQTDTDVGLIDSCKDEIIKRLNSSVDFDSTLDEIDSE